MQKIFIGPQLRRLRTDEKLTQSEMAKSLGISTSYVNLLENNERSVSVTVLLKLFEAFGVDWRDITEDETSTLLSDMRAVILDPMFEEFRPDLAQLRASMVHSPDLARCFMQLHKSFQAATDRLMSVVPTDADDAASVVSATPESQVHGFFRQNRNHFPELEAEAEAFWDGEDVPRDDIYARVKSRMRDDFGLSVQVVPVTDLPNTLRTYDPDRREVLLSEALDHPNRLFQLMHITALVEQGKLLDEILSRSGITEPLGLARCRVELANYFAAAVLMPYEPFLREARESKYDMDHVATRFGVSFEQACHRTTTLQRSGAQGVEYGGACPRLDVHTAFRTPGRIIPQFVEMPDQSRFFVFARTVERPAFARHRQDMRLSVALGCAMDHLSEIGYADGMTAVPGGFTQIGINCRVCPRTGCDQRAHQTSILARPVDVTRRGPTRYDA